MQELMGTEHSGQRESSGQQGGSAEQRVCAGGAEQSIGWGPGVKWSGRAGRAGGWVSQGPGRSQAGEEAGAACSPGLHQPPVSVGCQTESVVFRSRSVKVAVLVAGCPLLLAQARAHGARAQRGALVV